MAKRKSKEIKVEAKPSEPNIIEINKVKYIFDKEKFKKIDGIDHTDKLIFKRFDEEKYRKNLILVTNALAKRTTKAELLKEILKNIDYKSLRKLARRIKKKKPIKKHKGCLGFKIGDAYIQLLE